MSSEPKDGNRLGDFARLPTRASVERKLQACIDDLDALGLAIPANHAQLALDKVDADGAPTAAPAPESSPDPAAR